MKNITRYVKTGVRKFQEKSADKREIWTFVIVPIGLPFIIKRDVNVFNNKPHNLEERNLVKVVEKHIKDHTIGVGVDKVNAFSLGMKMKILSASGEMETEYFPVQLYEFELEEIKVE